MRTRIFKADKLLLPALTIFVLSLANAPAAPAQSNRTVFVEGNRAGGSYRHRQGQMRRLRPRRAYRRR